MTIEFVDFPIKNGDFSYVNLPEGTINGRYTLNIWVLYDIAFHAGRNPNRTALTDLSLGLGFHLHGKTGVVAFETSGMLHFKRAPLMCGYCICTHTYIYIIIYIYVCTYLYVDIFFNISHSEHVGI